MKHVALSIDDGQTTAVPDDVEMTTPLSRQQSSRQSIGLHASRRRDDLTGLDCRDAFFRRIDRLTDEGASYGISVVMIDIDRMRQINDDGGQRAGDRVLQHIGNRLARSIRPGDIAARLGGKTFGIVLTNLGTGARAEAGVRALYERLKHPVRFGGQRIDISITAGAAHSGNESVNASTLCRRAESALDRAKVDGCGSLVGFDLALGSSLLCRQQMLARAHSALAGHNIIAHYQPKVDLRLGTIVGFEALLRCRTSADTVEPPAAIWAAFEEPRLARQITDAMLSHVFADLARWQRRGIDIPVAINVSDADLRQDDFAERLLGRLAVANIPPSRIEIEITETVFLDRNQDHLAGMLHKLNDAGIRIALDDFGTGYASLSHLKQLPVDVIKIDRSFVVNLRNDPGDRAIAEAMLGMAQSLAIEVVAEGIEHACDAEFLRDRGCQLGQGYLFGEAIAAHGIPDILKLPPFWTGMLAAGPYRKDGAASGASSV